MKNVDAKECKVQILVCTNERQDRAACKMYGGQEFYQRIKDRIKKEGLVDTHWATRTGCLGFCNTVGTTVVIHPAGGEPRWFTEVTAEDFDQIWSELASI